MNKLITTLFFICIALVFTNAQQNAHYSQFFSNKLIQNPGYAGSAEVLSLSGLHRQQWVGLKGAPSTQTISLHAPVFNKRVGLGLSILRDDITISENWDIITSYAYRIKTGEGTLSLGIQADLRFMKIKWNEVDALEINDDEIPALNSQRFKPDFAAGIYYYTDRMYLGLAVQNMITANKLKDLTDVLDYLPLDDKHVYVMAGYAWPISENVDFAPVALLKFVKNTPFDIDINASFIFYEKLWAGLSWRKDDSIDVIIQYQLNQQLRLGIAYDYTISELQRVNSGSYELFFQYDFRYDDSGFTNLRFF